MSRDPDDISTTTAGVAVLKRTGAAQVPTLVIVAGHCGVGRMFTISAAETVIGRGNGCEICLDDDTISRRHARIERNGNELVITDLASRNGTFVGEARVERQVLKDGDKVQIGSSTVMKFHYRDSLDEALQRNLYESATRDPLTGVHTKKYFMEMLEKDLKFSSRRSAPLSVMMLDVDHFKQVNDSRGHLAGDRVLSRIATAINQTVRSHDLFARWGGEEFVVLLRDCKLVNAIEAAERMRALVERLSFDDGVKLTVSIGVSSVEAGLCDSQTLVQLADQCLYRAKHGGRNQVISQSADRETQPGLPSV